MVRPERFELPTFWFVGLGFENLNALSTVAYGRKSFRNLSSVGLHGPQFFPSQLIHRRNAGAANLAENWHATGTGHSFSDCRAIPQNTCRHISMLFSKVQRRKPNERNSTSRRTSEVGRVHSEGARPTRHAGEEGQCRC